MEISKNYGLWRECLEQYPKKGKEKKTQGGIAQTTLIHERLEHPLSRKQRAEMTRKNTREEVKGGVTNAHRTVA